MSMMKKLIAAATGIGSILAVAAPAFAQTTINPCPTTGFNVLCNLNANNIGSLIETGVVILLVIATIVSLFFLIWGGIRWITSGGDKAKVTEARSHIIAAIVGLVISFLAFFILSVILHIFGLGFGNIVIPQLP